jgi:hypothetical protein
MSQRDEHWEPDDEDVARRLRDGRSRLSAFELDGIKTTVMARVRPSSRKRPAPRSRLLVAMVTVGLMVAGTAGAVATSNGSFSSGTGAAQAQYKPCPNDQTRTDSGRCVVKHPHTSCPNDQILTDSGRCVVKPKSVHAKRPRHSRQRR